MALNAASGAPLWRKETATAVLDAPAVADGLTYWAAGDGGGGDVLLTLDGQTGEVTWERRLPGLVTRLSAQGGLVYVATGGTAGTGNISALNGATGEFRRQWQGVGVLLGPPTLAGATVYFATYGQQGGGAVALELDGAGAVEEAILARDDPVRGFRAVRPPPAGTATVLGLPGAGRARRARGRTDALAQGSYRGRQVTQVRRERGSVAATAQAKVTSTHAQTGLRASIALKPVRTEAPTPRTQKQSVPQAADLDARFFRGLGDSTRLRILQLRLEGERSVGEIVDVLGVLQGWIASHLMCLRWCGYVTTRREGRRVYYSVTDPRVREILRLAQSMRRDHAASLNARAVIESPPAREREDERARTLSQRDCGINHR